MNIKHNNGGGPVTEDSNQQYRQCDNELSTESSNGYNEVSSSNSDISGVSSSDDDEFEMLEVD